MLENEQWSCNSVTLQSLKVVEISCLGSDARSYFETFTPKLKTSFRIKSRTGEEMGQFFAGPINKADPSFTSGLTGVREG